MEQRRRLKIKECLIGREENFRLTVCAMWYWILVALDILLLIMGFNDDEVQKTIIQLNK
jgi:hypothetical protein